MKIKPEGQAHNALDSLIRQQGRTYNDEFEAINAFGNYTIYYQDVIEKALKVLMSVENHLLDGFVSDYFDACGYDYDSYYRGWRNAISSMAAAL